jgi:NADPH2:quinone reductase
MRAVVVREFGGIENAALGDMPKPEPKAGEVLLEIRATAVNFVDLVMMSGNYQFKPQLPFVPGKLPAGMVAAVGAGVTKFKPGDHAIAMAEQGGFAEFVAMPESQCVKLPPSLPFDEAAAMSLIYDTAYFALRDRARIKPGESVLVLGATGGVGLAAIQLAKAMGGTVLAGVASKGKADIVRAAGADVVIDLAAADLKESLRAQVFANTGDKGVDIIIDMLGGDYFDAAVRALAWCGRLVVIGFASGRIPSIKANYFLVKNIEISGMQVSDYRKRRPADMQACFREIFDWHAAGKLKPLPTKVYPIEQFAEAMKDIRDRKQRGRVVLSQGK